MLNSRDIELLEAYLDDALSPSQVERLDNRLQVEGDLLDVLTSLRRERQLRIAAITSFMPDDDEGGQFAQTLLAGVARQNRQKKVARWTRALVAVAACVVIGFAIGRIGTPESDTAHSIVGNTRQDGGVLHSIKATEGGPYQVAVLDENGKTIAVQRFDRLEDARQFSEDLGKYQSRLQQVQDGQAMLISDQF